MNGRIPIKELVALFESPEPEIVPPTPSHPTSQQSGPPPSPARFVQHPLLKKSSYPSPPIPPVRKPIPASKQQPVTSRIADKYNGLPSTPPRSSIQLSALGKRHDDAVHLIDVSIPTLINDSDRHDQTKPATQQPVTTRRRSSNAILKSPSYTSHDIPLVPISSYNSTKVSNSDSSWPPSYESSDWAKPPSSSQTTMADSKFRNNSYKDDDDDNLNISSFSQDDHYNPIAAKTVFSRGAAPLSLPALDEYLSKAPQPTFTPFFTPKPTDTKKAKTFESNIFPPLDLLQASKKTLDDLEKNATVPSFFTSRSAIFSALLNVFTGILGSSLISTYYSLQGLYDSLQLTALLLSTIVSHNQTDTSRWRQVLLGTIPNVLAFNLGHTVISLIIFVILMIISACLLYYFHIETNRISRESTLEGLQAPAPGGKWGLILSTFFLSVIYLPLSTISVHAIVWSSDFWPNTTSPTSAVCFSTTLDPNQINFAPVIVILACLTFGFLTIWFPIRLARAINTAVPTIDKYTELGRLRNTPELNHAYERMLERDNNPLSFLYQSLRMGWATYSSIYLWIKLSTLLLVALLDPNNCIFMHANSYIVTIVRQVLLLLAMTGFLIVQSKFGPFLNPVSNASEWFSRLGYVVFALFGLIVALRIPTSVQDLFNGPFLYIAYIIDYGLVFYFFFIGFSFSQNLIKKITRRMDFSIDIFSPKLDISPTSKHTRRRIWQESLSVLLYLTPECMMPKDERPLYTDLKALPVPPYLVHFRGTVGERHSENLKILGEVGGMDYAKGIVLYTGASGDHFNDVRRKIQKEFIGPDCYWRDPERELTGGCFGSAWWIPFPPTLVMKYDSGQTIALKTLDEFQEYVRQNEDGDICQRRNIRLALRSLDGQVVRWPYTYIQNVGKRFSIFDKNGYSAHSAIHYESGVFTIQRNGTLVWKTIDLGSGFNVKLTYDKNVQVDGSIIGLTSDFDLTPILARFLSLNQQLIHERTMSAEALIDDYRHSLQIESQSKIDSLSYQFLCTVYSSPKDMHKLADVLSSSEERNIKLREMFVEHENAIVAANERLMMVSRSEAATWWYLFWDDLWRRNNATVSNLKTHATDFDPSYPSSIAYHLLPRAALESFLIQRGLMSSKKGGSWGDFMHSGIINKIYFRLNQIVFKGSSNNAIHYHLGNNPAEIDLDNFTLTKSSSSGHIRSSTLGTGGGTDHNDSQIRARPMYKWEAIFDDPLAPSGGKPHKRWLPKLATWFGIDPHWEPNNALSSGISLDVVLEDGNYVLIEHAVHSLKSQQMDGGRINKRL